MLIPLAQKKTNSAQGEVAKANCAGRECGERDYCRRYRVRIGEVWEQSTGVWASYDVERLALGGDCASFKRWIPERAG